VNAERFTSPELKEYERKILAADERILEIERLLFVDLRAGLRRRRGGCEGQRRQLRSWTCWRVFAKLAADRSYVRPEFNAAGELLIVGGRHPVIEELLRGKGERFIPNDLCFEPKAQQLLLITGEHGREVDVFAADGADCVDGPGGIVCAGAASTVAIDGFGFYEDWGER